jgi:predicted DCC family thiol-disulfide oxidoreductase YuxK
LFSFLKKDLFGIKFVMMNQVLLIIILILSLFNLSSLVIAFRPLPVHSRSSMVRKSTIYNNLDNTLATLNDNKIDLLYDSDCPICAMEVEFLKKRDIHHRIKFTDLSSPDYDPSQHGDVQFADGMRKIRAILPDKTVVTGVEVFRQTYNAIGLGWIFDITKIPIIGKAADALYDIWAENRLRITGRGDLADILKERAEKLRESNPAECDTDACDLDFDEDS